MASPTSKIAITLLYPKSEKFDMNYYLTSHMPKVESQFSKHGMEKWQVIQTDPKSGYVCQCILWFRDQAAADEAFKNAEEIMKDVANYTDGKPVSVPGAVVGEN